MSIAPSIPKTAVVLPSNVRVVNTSGTLILQKVKRRVRKFKTTKEQRARLRTAARKFKLPLLTGMAIAPAALLSLNEANQKTGLMLQLFTFARFMLSFYTGMLVNAAGQVVFEPRRLAVGWGPVVAIGAIKMVAKGRVMAINRALSRAQIPANLS